jgi:hypothetical protein
MNAPMTTPIMHPITLKLTAIPGAPLLGEDPGLDWALVEEVLAPVVDWAPAVDGAPVPRGGGVPIG